MRLLLDTHALLWWFAGDLRLPLRARSAINDPENAVHVSAVSAWEIAIKYRIGKLPQAALLLTDFTQRLGQQGFVGLRITIDHALRAGALPGPHEDPFDRMLIAQAQVENLAIVSNETAFDRYGVVRVW